MKLLTLQILKERKLSFSFYDDSRELIDAFGVWGKKKFRGNEYEGVLRTTFIIDEEGVIERVIDKVNTKDHADQILD